MIKKNINLDEVKEMIISASSSSKFYIGSDSSRYKIQGLWHAEYTTVVIIHKDGNKGCKIFGQVEVERDYDQKKDKPSMRLMNEVIKTANMYILLQDVLENKNVQIHIDISGDKKKGSSCVMSEAIGYIQGMCNVIPMIKPVAWAASYGADRFTTLVKNPKVA